jgi:maltokinase
MNDLATYLAAQRWYAGSGPPERVEIEQSEQITVDLRSLVVVTEAGTYHVLDGPEDWLAILAHVDPDHGCRAARPMGVEQSNTSVVFDERLIMKVFRRLHPGKNLDVEVTGALASAGFGAVAEPLAVWTGGDYTKGVVQPFLAGGKEGWALALAAASTDFAGEAAELGRLTADMHRAMAGAFGSWPGQPHAWADMIERGLDRLESPDERAAARQVVQRLRSVADPGPAIRVHGDYHLGQVMRTDEGWYVLDFEGEPARPIDERRQPSSPMKDVSGMLRSFGYAASVGHAGERWEQDCRDAFLASYTERSPLPDPAVLDAFELDKAVYELAYERAYRPDWVDVPRHALRRLLGIPR